MGRAMKTLALLLALSLSLPALASVLPFGFVIDKVTDVWLPQRKAGGLIARWEVQRYTQGKPVGAPAPGELALSGGMYRATAGEGADRVVRVFDNSAGAALTGGRFARLAPETQAALAEGILLRSGSALTSLIESWGADTSIVSWGRMPQDSDEILFHSVLRYGAPAGPDDLSRAQIWIEPHRFLIHRVVAPEAGKWLVVDYSGHGEVDEKFPWLPAHIQISQGGELIWSARLLSVTGKVPAQSLFSIPALEAEGSR